jgi:phage host-nuclease inhibitor protein Gam
MATLTQKEYDKFLKQIQDAQRQVSALSTQVNQKYPKAPTGQVLGASTTLNAAQMGGAGGRGFDDTATQTAISNQAQTATEQGLSMSQASMLNTNSKGQNIGGAPATMSREQADYAIRGAGLAGMVDAKQFAGMNPAEAQRKIQEEKAKRAGQISANTSFAFNPETIAGTKKIVDRVGIGLNDIMADSFKSKGTQADQIKATLDASARQIASLFTSQDEYNQAVMANPQLQQTLATFQKLGGDVNAISTQIQTPVTQPNVQSTGDYLSSMTNPQADREAEKRAIDELIPEREVIQAEIARQQQIPEEMMSLYFGTEDQVGLLEMKKNQALEEKRIIEQKEKNEQTALKAKAKLMIEKQNADMRVETAKIEENRLAAKNYMTGMLAKLGALNTTGAAPLALQTLETKYQIATQQLENQYKYAEQEIRINLDDALNNVETETDEKILALEQDLTKDYETITKEIMKLQQAADRETYNLTVKYATQLRQRTTAYTKELQAEAEKNAKAFAKIAGGGLDINKLAETVGDNVSEGQYVPKKGVALPNGEYVKLSLTPTQETQVASAGITGAPAIRYFVSLPSAFKDTLIQEVQSRGTKYSTLAPLVQRYEQWQEETKKPAKEPATKSSSGLAEKLEKLKAMRGQ